jgi:hypothetical protein
MEVSAACLHDAPSVTETVMIIIKAKTSSTFYCVKWVISNAKTAYLSRITLESTAGERIRCPQIATTRTRYVIAYVETFLAAIGTFPTIALSITWNANNTKRALSFKVLAEVLVGGVIGS